MATTIINQPNQVSVDTPNMVIGICAVLAFDWSVSSSNHMQIFSLYVASVLWLLP